MTGICNEVGECLKNQNNHSRVTEICDEVSECLKNKIISILLSIYCIAHRTNFASLETINSAPCKILSTLFDNLINDIGCHFRRSSKVKTRLSELQKKFIQCIKILEKISKKIDGYLGGSLSQHYVIF